MSICTGINYACLLLILGAGALAHSQDAGPSAKTAKNGVDAHVGIDIDPGRTGFAAKRLVMAGACPQGCPWGELGAFVREALAPIGYEVIVCGNCNGIEGPRIVANASNPPPLRSSNLASGVKSRVTAPVDFGVTESGFLASAYGGRPPYNKDGPFRNLRLIAKIEDPTYLLVAVKAATGITDLSEIKSKRLRVKILASGPASSGILKEYGLTRQLLHSWGASVAEPRGGKELAFDVLISDLASPANNPESAFWTTASQKYELKFLDLPESLLQRLSSIPGEQRVTAQWGLLRGLNRSVNTVGRSGEAIFCRTDIPEQDAYAIAKAIDAHRAALKWYIRPYSYDPQTVWQNLDVPLSPGAERYYREVQYLR